MVRYLVVLLGLLVLVPASAKGAEEACVDCHKSTDFMVTNKKLYDYYQNWQRSTHGQEDVECSDCHGGNPKAVTKETAHSGMAGQLHNPVSFKAVPKMCGDCHENLYKSYVTSKHFEHLDKKKQVEQGPNCVTCHGSVSAKALDVTSVRGTCDNCHNPKTDNHPGFPVKAEALLNDLNSIRAFARFISIRGNSAEKAELESVFKPKIDALAVTWHTFDLNRIEPDTKALLEYAKEKRNAIKTRRKAKPGTSPDGRK